MPNITDIDLSTTFEAKGNWWLPAQPERPLSGTLQYSPMSITLSLIGSLVEQDPDQLGVVKHDFVRAPIIYGHTEMGPISLVGAYCISTTHNLHEVTESCYSSRFIVIGAHVPDESIPSNYLSFESDVIDEFFGGPEFDVRDLHEGGSLVGKHIRHRSPPDVVLASKENQWSLTFREASSLTHTRSSITLSARKLLLIESYEPQVLEWFLEQMWRLCQLLSLLTDETATPRRVEIELQDSNYPVTVLWRKAADSREQVASAMLLFYFGHLADSFNDIVTLWFEASPTLQDGIILFSDARRSRGEIVGRFLILTQAVEAVSRATSDDVYMPVEEYEQVRHALFDAIPKTVATDHRASLKSRIKYGNEVSLRNRLKRAFDAIGDDATACVCTSRSNFINRVVDTRNYLTHYSDELRDGALRGVELSWACEKLAMLLRFLLLQQVGIAPEFAAERFKNHSRLMQYMYLYSDRGE